MADVLPPEGSVEGDGITRCVGAIPGSLQIGPECGDGEDTSAVGTEGSLFITHRSGVEDHHVASVGGISEPMKLSSKGIPPPALKSGWLALLQRGRVAGVDCWTPYARWGAAPRGAARRRAQ